MDPIYLWPFNLSEPTFCCQPFAALLAIHAYALALPQNKATTLLLKSIEACSCPATPSLLHSSAKWSTPSPSRWPCWPPPSPREATGSCAQRWRRCQLRAYTPWPALWKAPPPARAALPRVAARWQTAARNRGLAGAQQAAAEVQKAAARLRRTGRRLRRRFGVRRRRTACGAWRCLRCTCWQKPQVRGRVGAGACTALLAAGFNEPSQGGGCSPLAAVRLMAGAVLLYKSACHSFRISCCCCCCC